MAQYDGTIRINTKIDTKGLNKGESLIKGSFDRIGSAAKKLAATIAAAFAVGKIIEFGKAAIQAAADFEAMEAQFSQVFGDMESVASKSLSQIAKQAGITEERMKSSYTKIAAFAKTTGMDAAGSIDLANRAMVAVADSAAFYDRSLEDVTESLQSFLKGNYENDAALGLSATEFTRNAAANKLYGKSFIELSEAQKQLTLLQMVEDANRLSGALGQAAREADTWTNQTGNLNQALANLKANLGKFILPVAIQAVKMVTNVINAINAMISKLYAAASAFRSFSSLLTGNQASAGAGVQGAGLGTTAEDYSGAAAAADSLAESTEGVADATKDAKKAAEAYLSPLDEINKLGKEEASAGSGAGAGGIDASGGVDFGSLAGGDTVIDEIDRKAQALMETLAGLIKPFKDAWESEGASTVEAVRFAFGSLGELARSVGKSFYEVWTNGTGTQTLELILQIAQNVLDTIGNVADRLNEAWNANDVGTSIIQGIFDIYNTILGTVERITGATAEWAGELDFTPLLESINGLLESMQPLTENIGDGLAWFYENVMLPIAGWAIEDAVPAFLDMLSAAIGTVNEVIEALKPLGAWLWDEFLQPLGEWAGEAVISAMETITDLLQKFGDWVSENQETIQGFAITLGVLFSASMAAKILSAAASLGEYIINAGGLVAALKATTASLVANTAAWFSNIAAKIADKAETLAIIGLYAKDFIVNLAKGTAALVKQAAQFAINTAAKIADTAAQVAMTAATVAWNAACALATAATTAFGAAVAFLTSPIGIAIAAVAALIAIGILVYKNWDTIKEKAIEIWGAIRDWFKKTIEKIKEFFSGLWKGIKETFANVGSWFKEKFEGAVTGIKNAFSSVGDFFSGVWKGIKDAFGNIAGWFKDKFSAAWEAVKNVFSKGGKIFDGIKDGILNGLKSVINCIIDGINKVISIPFKGLNTALEGIKSVSIAGFKPFDWLPTIDVPQIPRLATGAVIPANKEFLAVLGDQKHGTNIEAPLDTLRQANEELLINTLSKLGLTGNMMGNNPQTIVVKLIADGKNLTDLVIRNGKVRQMSSGMNPFALT